MTRDARLHHHDAPAGALRAAIAWAAAAIALGFAGVAWAEPRPAEGKAPAPPTNEAAAPADETAAALLARAFDNLYAQDYVQTMTMAARTPGSKVIVKELQIIRKQSEKPGKALVRFLKPGSIRNTAVLILENEGATDDLYIYLPALRRTRHLSSAQRADAFFGTDLAYEDVEPKRASDWVATYVPQEDLEGEGCRRISIVAAPGFESTYERMESCIRPEDGVILHTSFFRGGVLVKQLRIDADDVRIIGTRSIPFSMTFTTVAGSSETRVLTESYELPKDIPEKLFTTRNLEGGDARNDRNRLER